MIENLKFSTAFFQTYKDSSDTEFRIRLVVIRKSFFPSCIEKKSNNHTEHFSSYMKCWSGKTTRTDPVPELDFCRANNHLKKLNWKSLPTRLDFLEAFYAPNICINMLWDDLLWRTSRKLLVFFDNYVC